MCSFLNPGSREGGSGSEPSHQIDFKQAITTKQISSITSFSAVIFFMLMSI